MKPALLVNPPLGRFEAKLRETYDVVHWPQDKARAAEITAAFVIGGVGLSNETITSLPNLKLIACMSAGFDGVDVDFAKSHGVSVTNCPNTNNEDVADMAIGLLLAAVRRISEGDRLVRAGKWRGDMPFTGRVSGKKLGIVGLGAIGVSIAERAAGFRLDIAWQGPRAKPDAPWRYESDLIKLAEWSDFLIIACPANAQTYKMIDARVIEALGPQGALVNIARGQIVDEDALIQALKSGALGCAGLDVFQEEPTPAERWADVPNVALMPHHGGGTLDGVRDLQMLALENVRRFLAGEPLKTPV